MSKKQINKIFNEKSKKASLTDKSYNKDKQQWVFTRMAKDGIFAFTKENIGENMAYVFERILEYSQRTWNEILLETHDRKNKSCHHSLMFDSLSREAQKNIKKANLSEENYDKIFSMRLNNKIRIVGLKENDKFVAIWYDENHQFCPSKK